MTARELLERLVKDVEGVQAHLLSPIGNSLEWWLALDRLIWQAVHSYTALVPMLLRARFAQAARSPQEPPKSAEATEASPTAPKAVQGPAKAQETAPTPTPPKPAGQYAQGGPQGMGFTDPAGHACEPSCPKCEARMHDERLTKKKASAPDFRCVNAKATKPCKGVYWPKEFQSMWEGANDGGVPKHYVSESLDSLERQVSANTWRLVVPNVKDPQEAKHA